MSDRTPGTGTDLMEDLRDRLVGRMQLTTDGYHTYLEAVESVFGGDLDYARVVKQYGQSDEDHTQVGVVGTKVVGVSTETVAGNPDPGKMSTSLIERQNLNLRTNIRRFTRKTNAFSKKAENHAAAVGLHFFNYNFCLKHGTLGMTPAMAAGIADYPFGIRDVVEMVEGARPKPNRPKVYNRKGRQRRRPQRRAEGIGS